MMIFEKIKNMKFKYIIYFMLLSIFSSCAKDFLKKAPDEELDTETVFEERRYAEQFLSSVYFNIPEMLEYSRWFTRNPYTGGSDEVEITWTGAYSHLINSGAWNPSDHYGSNEEPDMWGFQFEGIRKANLFLDHIDKTPMNEEEKRKWIGEATFLRAFFHFNIFQLHGPIPIIDKTINLNDDFLAIRRAPVNEVVDFIVKECDKAAADLDWTVPADRYGRITKVAALALKARVLLYAASPLFNGDPAYSNFTDHDGNRLFPDADPNLWTKAAEAAKECIEGAEANGYGLYYSADKDPMRSYQDLFLVRNNQEVLFARNLGTQSHFERCANPTGYGGYSIYCPTQELIDAYEMRNGEAPITGYHSDGAPIINPESGYQEDGFTNEAHPEGYWPTNISNMYIDRDPRFYASINFSGAEWKGRRIEFWYSGVDGRQRAGSDYCISGYLMKKMVSPTANIPEGRFGLNTWIHYRLGEQYLNYAEALNESEGPVADVYKYVNAIRNRSGMPNLPAGLDQDEMRERIRHERRIELAFEAHRFFDVRRWKIAEDILGSTIHGMDIQSGSSLQDPEFYNRVKIEDRVFNAPKHYLWPIRISEIEKNPNLVQNLGW